MRLLRLLPMWDYICPRCRREVKRNSHKCPFCGERFPFPLKVPPKCLKNPEALEDYVHKHIFPKISAWQRDYLAQFFTELFSDGFESGDFSAWTDVTETPEVVTGYAHHGTYSCKIDDLEGPYKDLGSSYSTLYVRVYFKLTSYPDAQGYRLGIVRVGQSGTYWDYPLFVEVYQTGTTGSSTKFSLFDGYRGERINTDITPTLNQWYCVEVKFSTDAPCLLYIDGVQKAATTYSFPLVANRVGVGLGSAGAYQAVGYIDCVVVADTYIGLESEIILKQWSQIGITAHTFKLPVRSLKVTQTSITSHTFSRPLRSLKLTQNLNTIHMFLHHKIFKLINSLNTSHIFWRHKLIQLSQNLRTTHMFLHHKIFKLTQALRTLGSWTLPIPATLKQWFATLQTTHIFRRPLRTIMLAQTLKTTHMLLHHKILKLSQTLRTTHIFLHHKIFKLSQTLRTVHVFWRHKIFKLSQNLSLTHVFTRPLRLLKLAQNINLTHIFSRPFRFVKLTQNMNLTHVLKANKLLKFITQILKPLHNWIKRTFGGFPFKIAVEERYPVNISAEAAEKIKVTFEDREPIKITVEEMVE